MNILVVSDNYTTGGLEKHILELAEAGTLRQDSFYFVFAKYTPCGRYVIDKNVVGSLQFANEQTTTSLVNDVSLLASLIISLKIDILHLHPFHSFLPSVIACQMTGIPCIYTYHGTLSYNFPKNEIESFLFQQALSRAFSAVLSVNEDQALALSSFFPTTSCLYFPNPISSPNYPLKPNNCKKWALVSRLDDGKSKGIVAFLKWLKELPISHLDIYGSGSEETMLRAVASEEGLDDRITWKGFCPDWINESSQYDGIVGMDRVVLEAASSGLPVIILSRTGNPCGLLTPERYEIGKKCNFNGDRMGSVTKPQQLASEINEVEASRDLLLQLQRQTQSDYSRNSLYIKYTEILKTASPKSCPGFLALYNVLSTSNEIEIDSEFCLNAIAQTMIFDIDNPLVFTTFSIARTTLAATQLAKADNASLAAVCSAHGTHLQELERQQEGFGARLGTIDGGLFSANQTIFDLKRELRTLAKRIKKLEDGQHANEKSLLSLKASPSWRIGRAITALPRWIKKHLHN